MINFIKEFKYKILKVFSIYLLINIYAYLFNLLEIKIIHLIFYVNFSIKLSKIYILKKLLRLYYLQNSIIIENKNQIEFSTLIFSIINSFILLI